MQLRRCLLSIVAALVVMSSTGLPAVADLWIPIRHNWVGFGPPNGKRDWGPFRDWKITFRIPAWVKSEKEEKGRSWKADWSSKKAGETFERAWRDGAYRPAEPVNSHEKDFSFIIGATARGFKYSWRQYDAFAKDFWIMIRVSDSVLAVARFGDAGELVPISSFEEVFFAWWHGAELFFPNGRSRRSLPAGPAPNLVVRPTAGDR